eukprot:TRINITY_DN2288_c0_g1_i6.p1 TRINITY_DN2288_c0_g1~~TRINITY_DN2288_c0_g1_i6.p1  ORF type:complete len:301 (+),score=34.05 TRINITY_DN2288_c0_g1_i6:69-971(+)
MNGYIGTTLYVRERGSYAFREVILENSAKTLSNLIMKIQIVLNNQNQVLSIVKEDGKKVEGDFDVCFLTHGMSLEITFANKFYWVVTDDLRSSWTQEFLSAVGPGQTRMSGEQARNIFTSSAISIHDLAMIWELADTDKDSYLNLLEYILARFLILSRQHNQTIPTPLPQSLIDTLLQNISIRPTTSPSVPTTQIAPGSAPLLPALPNPNSIVNSSSQPSVMLSMKNSQRGLKLSSDNPWNITKKRSRAYSQLFNEHSSSMFTITITVTITVTITTTITVTITTTILIISIISRITLTLC